MKQPLMTGSTKECLADFFKRFGKVEALWKFAGIQPQTESRWRLHEAKPEGEVLLRVQHFLDLAGYSVNELNDLPNEVFSVGQCIACGVIDIRVVVSELELPYGHYYDNFTRGIEPLPERLAKFGQLAEKYQTELAKTVAEKRLEVQSSLGAHQSSEVTSVNPRPSLDLVSPRNDVDLIEKFRQACIVIQDLGGELLKCPVKTRFEMRQRMGQSSNPVLHCTWEVLNKLLREHSNPQPRL